MARFKLGKLRQAKKGWSETLSDRINDGKVLPIISNAICNDLVFGADEDLVTSWAEYIEYPFSKNPDCGLARMTQYQSVMSKADPAIRADDIFIKEAYLDFLDKALRSIADEELVQELDRDAKRGQLSFSQVAARLERPPLDDGKANPLLLLADLPLPIYLTTSYHSFLENALRRANKTPHIEICRWDPKLHSIPSVFEAGSTYQPTPREPLVFHVHGLDEFPSSLVLTEDDHLDFLVAVSRDLEVIPLRVRQAIADSSLVLLGYGLRNWDFRVLFRGMITKGTDQRRPKSVFIQLLESIEDRNYLKYYLDQEAELEVIWSDTISFMQQLWEGWAGENAS